MAQRAPVFSIVAADINNDGNTDVLTGGNFFDIKPDIGRLDANASSLFIGNGKNDFTYVPRLKSGLQVKGQVRDMVLLKNNNAKNVIVAVNNAPVVILQY